MENHLNHEPHVISTDEDAQRLMATIGAATRDLVQSSVPVADEIFDDLFSIYLIALIVELTMRHPEYASMLVKLANAVPVNYAKTTINTLIGHFHMGVAIDSSS